jgi:hypothetical protein
MRGTLVYDSQRSYCFTPYIPNIASSPSSPVDFSSTIFLKNHSQVGDEDKDEDDVKNVKGGSAFFQ